MKLVPADAAHIPFLAERMRKSDKRECEAFGLSPAAALRSALASSLWALTALVEDEPHAMLGICSRNMLEGVGVPWMLGTDRVYASGRLLLKHGRGLRDAMHQTFPALENYVATENDRAIRFLRWLDFELHADTVNIGGVPFVRFARRV